MKLFFRNLGLLSFSCYGFTAEKWDFKDPKVPALSKLGDPAKLRPNIFDRLTFTRHHGLLQSKLVLKIGLDFSVRLTMQSLKRPT